MFTWEIAQETKQEAGVSVYAISLQISNEGGQSVK